MVLEKSDTHTNKKSGVLKLKNMLSIMTFALIFILSAVFSTTASAEENFGVSTEPPTINEGEITPFGLIKPGASSVVDISKSTLKFSGVANNSTLYTNSHFTGQSSATYNIKNYRSGSLTVKVFKKGGIFSTQKIVISAGATGGGGIPSLDKSAYYYLSFNAPSNFSGSVY